MKFTPFNEHFAQQAADLVLEKYELIHPSHTALQPNAFTKSVIASDLTEWAGDGASVVAHEGDRLEGFIVGRFINFYQSNNAFFSPDWGHAVANSNPDRVLTEMYAWLTRSGQVDGSTVHAISTYDADSALKTALHNLEFGVHMMEGVLDIPADQTPLSQLEGITIRSAEPDDVNAIISLDKQLWAHLALPPTSLGVEIGDYPADSPKYRVPREGLYVSVAELEGQLVGFISSQLGVQEFTGLRNPKIPAINGAFVHEDHRNTDIGQALLDDIFRHARAISAPYVTVDFESTNVEGSGFWRSRRFTPLAYGMTRRIPV